VQWWILPSKEEKRWVEAEDGDVLLVAWVSEGFERFRRAFGSDGRVFEVAEEVEASERGTCGGGSNSTFAFAVAYDLARFPSRLLE